MADEARNILAVHDGRLFEISQSELNVNTQVESLAIIDFFVRHRTDMFALIPRLVKSGDLTFWS